MPDGTPRGTPWGSRVASPEPRESCAHDRRRRAPSSFALDSLPHELQAHVLDFVAALPPSDLCAGARTSRTWHDRLMPALYADLSVHKENRAAVFAGLGVDCLTPAALEARASEAGALDDAQGSGGVAAYIASGPNTKVAALGHVRRLSLADPAAATTLVEALLSRPRATLLPALDTLEMGPQLFRYIVNTLASFGRPRSGRAFVSESLVANLQPRHVRIVYPTSRSVVGTFDPVQLARALAVLVMEWKPEVIEYVGVSSDFPPVHRQGTLSRIICGPCASGKGGFDADGADDTEGDAAACRAHGTLVRMHLRRTFGARARADLLDDIEEAQDPTDDGDIDADDVPDPAGARVEYTSVPCIAALDTDVFLDRTFAHWPTDVDVAQHVAFFP